MRPDVKTESLNLLVIEDNPDDADLLLLDLEQGGYRVVSRVVDSEADLRRAVDDRRWDLVISDHNLPGLDSIQALEIVRASDINVPFIITSGCIGEEVAVEAMQAGADDYVMKDTRARLLPAIERSLREAAVRRERRRALRQLEANEARLRVLTDNVPCVMLQLYVGGGRLCVAHLSGGAEHRLGVDDEAITADPDRLFGLFGDAGQSLRGLLESASESDEEVHWSGKVESGPAVGSWFDFRARRRRHDAELMVWDGIFFDVTQQKRVEIEVREINRRLRELAARANETREAERSRIAREIHDDLGGSLTALKIDLVRMRSGGETDEAKLGEMITLVDDTVQAVRRICAELHPRILEDFGLQAAIEWQLGRFRERTGLNCLLYGSLERSLGRQAEIALFRVFQEALTNIARHAGAAMVEVRVQVDDDNVLRLDVCDDGVGIRDDTPDAGDSFGMLGMRERMREVGGEVVWETRPGAGTRVGVRLPLSGDEGWETG